ncbi:hypothetical protein [Phormidium pseudopriestleyi]|uniref:hypothetical protein n=1 Tax=Phormidium pseudopriestleyi TaxID=1759527 RepID=UPI001A8ECED7|nr:hypothetical protein [Phormidium pseudopriestleyi]
MYSLRRMERLSWDEFANLTPVGSDKNGQAKRSRSSSGIGGTSRLAESVLNVTPKFYGNGVYRLILTELAGTVATIVR